MNMRRRRGAGFTLLEIVITAGLTAVIVVLGFALVTSAQQIGQMQQEQSAASRDAWLFVYRLSRELREGLPASALDGEAAWRGTSGSAKLLDEVSTYGWPDVAVKEFEARQIQVSTDKIQFYTLRFGSPNLPPGPGVIEYSLKRDTKSNVVNIVRRAAPLGVSLDNGETQAIRPSDVDSSLGFVSLEFRYLDDRGQWRPEWTDGKAMPRAVRVSVSTLLRPTRQLRVPIINQYSTQVDLTADSRIPQ